MSLTDFQRNRVYGAEFSARRRVRNLGGRSNAVLAPDAKISLNVAQQLADTVCNDNGLPPVTVVYDDEQHSASYWRDRSQITLPKWARVPTVLIHELAHHGTNEVFVSHGAEFVATYLEYLTKYLSRDVAQIFEEEFDAAGIHRKPEVRAARVRRVAVNTFNSTTETPVVATIVADNPPRRLTGVLEGVTRDTIRIGGEDFSVADARYFHTEKAA